MKHFVQLVLDLFDTHGAVATHPSVPHKVSPLTLDIAENKAGEIMDALQSEVPPSDASANALKAIDPSVQNGFSISPVSGVNSFAKFSSPSNNELASAVHIDEKTSIEPVATVYRHPNAKRIIVLQNTEIAYAFKRAKRRTIGMSVSYDGLTVSAPRWVGWGEIEAALKARAPWIVKKIVEMQEREKLHSKQKLIWANKAVLPLLGFEVQILLDSSHSFTQKGAVLRSKNGDVLEEIMCLSEGAKLYLALPLSAHPSQIQDSVQAWLMRQAKILFIKRLDHFALALGVKWTKLALSSASTRWGSATSDGSIRLNWRLIHFKLETIDYVVAHELSHLRVMDHSPKFWDTVREVVPDFKERRSALNERSAPVWST